jgi:hypothetical protein
LVTGVGLHLPILCSKYPSVFYPGKNRRDLPSYAIVLRMRSEKCSLMASRMAHQGRNSEAMAHPRASKDATLLRVNRQLIVLRPMARNVCRTDSSVSQYAKDAARNVVRYYFQEYIQTRKVGCEDPVLLKKKQTTILLNQSLLLSGRTSYWM